MDERLDGRGRKEAEAIAEYQKRNYPKPALTADICVFAGAGEGRKVLLIRRGGHPYLGCWALPGGFAEATEAIEGTARRELEEETGLAGLNMRLVGVYSAPGRDPRGWTVSVAFAADLAAPLRARAGDDAREAGWFDLVRGADGKARPALPAGERLAFDHDRIIADAARFD